MFRQLTNCIRRCVGSCMSLAVVFACLCATGAQAATYYVANAPVGHPFNPGTQLEPLDTIQAAIDKPDATLVYVVAGTYQPIISNNKVVRIEALGDASDTFITGNNTTRCATLGSAAGQNATTLVGFTLMNGRTAAGNLHGAGVRGGTLYSCVIRNCNLGSAAGVEYGTGAYWSILHDSEIHSNSTVNGSGSYGAVSESTLYNCKVYNNGGVHTGGAFNSTFYNSQIYNNTATQGGGAVGGVNRGTLYNCLLYGNYGNGAAAAMSATLYSCTVTRNRSTTSQAIGSGCFVYNSIVWNNQIGNNTGTDNNIAAGVTVQYTNSDPLRAGVGNMRIEPHFVDSNAFDFRVQPFSLCIAAGNAGAEYTHQSVDLNGKPRFDAYGRLTMGAYEQGPRFASPGGTTFYVNQKDGNDSNTGLGMNNAFATIQRAIICAADGDKIAVADGTYDPIICWPTLNKDLHIQSMGGPSVTFIDGKDIARCATLANDAGQNATKLIGFTLMRGRTTMTSWNNTMSGVVDLNRHGAGVKGGTLENCIIRDCLVNTTTPTIEYGSGARWSILKKCEIYNCNDVYGGSYSSAYGAVSDSTLYNCIVRNNRNAYVGGVHNSTLYHCKIYENNGSQAGDGTGGARLSTLYNCLVYGNLSNNAGSGASGVDQSTLYDCTVTLNRASQGAVRRSTVYNSIVWNNQQNNGGGSTFNFGTGNTVQYSCSDPIFAGEGNVSHDPLFMNAASDFRLQGHSPVVGIGNPVSTHLGMDLIHNPRIDANGRVSMGAYEMGARVKSVGRSIFYVDQANGDDFYNDGLNWDDAFATIRRAISCSVPGDRIIVNDGTYGPIILPVKNMAIHIESVNGPTATFIDGGNTTRCAELGLAAGENATRLTGFTLMNGRTLAANRRTQSTTHFQHGAGVVGGTLENCIIRNCNVGAVTTTPGEYGTAARWSILRNCEIYGNSAVNSVNSWGAVVDSTLYNCKVHTNTGITVGGGVNSTFYSCALYNNTAVIAGGATSGTRDSTLYNCTVYGNRANAGVISGGATYNTVVWGNTPNNTVTGTLANNHVQGVASAADPLFVNAPGPAYDFRIGDLSPLRNMGNLAHWNPSQNPLDLARLARSNGTTIGIGAYEYIGVPGIEFDANGGEGVMTVQPLAAQPATIKPNTFTHPQFSFLGWSTRATGSVKYTDGGAITVEKTVKLYAVWDVPQTYTLVFHPHGGEGAMAPMTFTIGQSKALTANAFTKKGSDFIQWGTFNNRTFENKEVVSNLAPAGGTITLYALWTQPEWTPGPGTSHPGVNPNPDGSITVDGHDGRPGTIDDLTIHPGSSEIIDVDRNGYVKVPEGGHVTDARDRPIRDQYGREVDIPPGSIVTHDGVIIIGDGLVVNGDGTVTIPEGGKVYLYVPPAKEILVPVGEGGATYDPDVPGVITNTDPPTLITIPDGIVIVDPVLPPPPGGPYAGEIIIPGQDGIIGTDDDITITDGTVDPETGYTTVNEGPVTGKDDVPLTDKDGNVIPPGSIITDDGVIIIPPPGGELVVNDDGTITIPDGGKVYVYVPPMTEISDPVHPGGKYDPSIPAIIVDTVPPTIIIIPSGVVVIDDGDDSCVVVPGPDGDYGTDDDVTIRPATLDDVDPGTGIVTVPEPGSVISTNGVPIIIDGITDPVDNTFPEGTVVLPDGTIIVPGPDSDGTPKKNPDGTVDVGPGDIIIVPPYDDPFIVPGPGGTYDPDIPGVILDTEPPSTILVPSGVVIVDGEPPSVIVPGPDGDYGTDDDVTIQPATQDDIDPGTGIVIVPEPGSVISTNGVPIVIDNISDPDGTFPPGTLVLPDGTIIVPGPDSDGTPKINPDGTVDVGPGDIIILPPYDDPFIVPEPGGKYDPTIPGVITDTEPAEIIILPPGLEITFVDAIRLPAVKPVIGTYATPGGTPAKSGTQVTIDLDGTIYIGLVNNNGDIVLKGDIPATLRGLNVPVTAATASGYEASGTLDLLADGVNLSRTLVTDTPDQIIGKVVAAAAIKTGSIDIDLGGQRFTGLIDSDGNIILTESVDAAFVGEQDLYIGFRGKYPEQNTTILVIAKTPGDDDDDLDDPPVITDIRIEGGTILITARNLKPNKRYAIHGHATSPDRAGFTRFDESAHDHTTGDTFTFEVTHPGTPAHFFHVVRELTQ